ncbi:MAG: hypothetical protein IJH40_10600 [Ruminococcus sp.]|uniref:hypothetical protein n=1 Tax=Ruminococcus sp. TaxID=41978 RepID=UPI0028735A41|nr:hypothetical protein [Ruminococcus sp.]MBQ3286068.1 hypothetical protein [Ruminococcus sp.]
MKIKELRIQKADNAALSISWTLSDGRQTAYELFLIREGCVVDGVKMSSGLTSCTLHTTPELMKEYDILLTVTAGAKLTTARAGFRIDKKAQLYLCVSY